MNTCDTCRYYNPTPRFEMNCSCPKFVYTGQDGKHEPDGLEYWDSEAYSASFKVGPKFGCVHHAALIPVSTCQHTTSPNNDGP